MMKLKNNQLLSIKPSDTTPFRFIAPPLEKIRTFDGASRSVFHYQADLPLPTRINPTHTDISRIFINYLNIKAVIEKKEIHSTRNTVLSIKTKSYDYVLKARSAEISALEYIQEATLVKLLSAVHIPVSQYLIVDLSRKMVPFDFSIIEKVRKYSLYSQPTNVCIQKMGSLIHDIHKITTSKYGKFRIDSLLRLHNVRGIHTSWQHYLNLNLHKHITTCLVQGYIDLIEAKNIERLFSGNVPNPPSVLLHGDLQNANVLLENGSVSAIVDWEDALVGDSLFDLAYYATGCFGDQRFDPKHWFASFLIGYGSRESDIIANRLFWLYYLRIALAKAIIRFRKKTDLHKGLPDTKSRITFALIQLQKFGQ